jgi:hypothetical protein
MSREYADKRIREALKLAKGNATKARQQIVAWTYEDQKLLQALTKPHLTGIVAHAINRVISRMESGADEEDDIPENPQSLDMPPETFGQEIMQILKNSNTTMFGHEGGATPGRRGQASQRHIDAMKKIASKAPSGSGKGKKTDR